MAEFKKEHEDMLRDTNDAVKRIELVLIGDKFQEKGLIQNVRCNKERIETMENAKKIGNRTIAIIGTVVTGISTGIIILINYLSR